MNPEQWPITDKKSYRILEDPIDLPTPPLVEPDSTFDCSVTLNDATQWTCEAGNCYESVRFAF